MSSPASRIATTVRACGLIAWLSLAPATAQIVTDGTNPPQRRISPSSLGYVGVDPGSARQFDLRGGRIEDSLPFDVQFYLQSPVAADVANVTGLFVQRRQDTICEQLFQVETAPQTGYLVPLVVVANRDGEEIALGASPPIAPSLSAERPPDDAREIRFERFMPAGSGPMLQAAGAPAETVGPGGSGRRVELSVPAPGLLPNRSICFGFQIGRLVDVERFRAQAAAAIDTELRDPQWVRKRKFGSRVRRTIVTRSDAYNRMRRKLIRGILATLYPGERLQGRSGSYFDPNVNLAGVSESYIERFNAILEEQINRFPTIRSIVASRERVEGLLFDLIDNPAFKRLKGSSLAGDLLGANGLLQLTVGRAQELAQGLEAGTAAVDLEAHWTPADLAATRARIAATETDVADLRRVVGRFGERPTWMSSEGISAEQLATLDALVGEILAELAANREVLDQFRNRLQRRADLIEEMVGELSKELIEVVRLRATTVASYQTRASWYVSADVGVGFAPDVEEIFSYLGTNIYLRPVNRKAPIKGLAFRKRFSFMIGLTNESLQRDGQLKGVIGTSPLLFAGGLRINEFVRLSAGALLFEDENPDPLLTDSSLAWTPFVSISIDWNLRKMFSQFGGALGLQEPGAEGAGR